MKSLLQTPEWAKLRESQGWRTHWVDEILVLEKPLPLGQSFLYAPEVDFFKINFHNFLEKTKEISKNSHALFLRLDFLNKNNTILSQKINSILKNQRFIKSFEEIQPEYRQIINITKSEEQILAQMKQKGRYNIRIAQKHGVVVESSSQLTAHSSQQNSDSKNSTEPEAVSRKLKANLDDFYEIFRETAERDGFQVRPKKYFEKLMEILKKDGLAELLVARYNNKVVAAEIVTFYSDIASYLYGASANEDRQTMAPYLLHWEAMKLAKEKGCKIYDLLAVSPFGVENHKYSGITRFKEQFGGQKVQTIGSWDMVYKPTLYSLFKLVEILRRK